MNRKTLFHASLAWITLSTAIAGAQDVQPIRALLITGGGYHDYQNQKQILTEGICARANVEWTIVLENPKPGAKPKIYDNPDWAKGFDVIVHNECFADYSDDATIESIVDSHLEAGVGSVMIHCAMHTFRDTKTKAWDKLVGVESRRHGAHWPIIVRNLAPEHPITKKLPRTWTTPKGELYHTSILNGAETLGVGFKDGEEETTKQTCIWANRYENVRTFATTLGHHNETMQESVYLDLVTNGLLWSCNKLRDDGTPKKGYEATASVSRQNRFRVLLADRRELHFDSARQLLDAGMTLESTSCCGAP